VAENAKKKNTKKATRIEIRFATRASAFARAREVTQITEAGSRKSRETHLNEVNVLRRATEFCVILHVDPTHTYTQFQNSFLMPACARRVFQCAGSVESRDVSIHGISELGGLSSETQMHCECSRYTHAFYILLLTAKVAIK
jgi:hypothetical protein